MMLDRIIDKTLPEVRILKKSSLTLSLIKHNASRVAREYPLIYPNRSNMRAIVDLYKYNKFLGITVDDLDRYISLTRFASGFDKAACDWCGICNGTLELFRSKLKEYFHTQYKQSEFVQFHVPMYIKNVMSIVSNTSNRDDKIAQDLAAWGVTNPVDKDKLRVFLKFVYTVEEVEQRWCPFAYITDLDLDRPYYYYSPYDVDHLRIVQKILREQGKITCNNCIKVLNQVEAIQTDYPSVFADYMAHIRSVVADPTRPTPPTHISIMPIMVVLFMLMIIIVLIIGGTPKTPGKSGTPQRGFPVRKG